MISPEPTTAQLRVLSHPTRLALLRRLRTDGPATARALGREFAIDSGAISYHLRRLAEGGQIVEDVERGTRRERWWRAVEAFTQFDSALHHDHDQLSREYLQAVVLSKADELHRVASTVAASSQEWLDTTTFFDSELSLTPAAAEELKQELLGVIDRYSDHSTADSEDARRVAAHLQLYPRS